jgi:hypothetical protein
VTERFPSESKKGMSRGGINFSEISDLGERHTDRIPTLDVTGLFTHLFVSKVEVDGIASRKRSCMRHRKDCVADSTSLNVPYLLFAGRVTVHLNLRTVDGGKSHSSLVSP